MRDISRFFRMVITLLFYFLINPVSSSGESGIQKYDVERSFIGLAQSDYMILFDKIVAVESEVRCAVICSSTQTNYFYCEHSKNCVCKCNWNNSTSGEKQIVHGNIGLQSEYKCIYKAS